MTTGRNWAPHCNPVSSSLQCRISFGNGLPEKTQEWHHGWEMFRSPGWDEATSCRSSSSSPVSWKWLYPH